MADWPGWWKYVRECVDRSKTGTVTFTVGEIVAGARSFDNSFDQRGVWNAVMNPQNDSYTGVLENDMICEPFPEEGRIEKVTFRLTD